LLCPAFFRQVSSAPNCGVCMCGICGYVHIHLCYVVESRGPRVPSRNHTGTKEKCANAAPTYGWRCTSKAVRTDLSSAPVLLYCRGSSWSQFTLCGTCLRVCLCLCICSIFSKCHLLRLVVLLVPVLCVWCVLALTLNQAALHAPLYTDPYISMMTQNHANSDGLSDGARHLLTTYSDFVIFALRDNNVDCLSVCLFHKDLPASLRDCRCEMVAVAAVLTVLLLVRVFALSYICMSCQNPAAAGYGQAMGHMARGVYPGGYAAVAADYIPPHHRHHQQYPVRTGGPRAGAHNYASTDGRTLMYTRGLCAFDHFC